MIGWAAALWGCAADDEANRDANAENERFRIWCGDHACAWTVEKGKVAPAPTWHRSAEGIGFLDDPTTISQIIDVSGANCLVLSALGNVDTDAKLFFEIDFDNNDEVDDTEPSYDMGAIGWETVYRETPVPEDVKTARIIFRKEGQGNATLAWADLSENNFCVAGGM